MYFSRLIQESERAFLYQNGRLIDYLRPGRHRRYLPLTVYHVELLSLKTGWAELTPERRRLFPADEARLLEVPAHHLALVRQDGRPTVVLNPGSYLLWQVMAHTEAQLVDMTVLKPEIPRDFWNLMPPAHFQQLLVFPYEKVLLYEEGAFRELLGEGSYGLSTWNRKLETVRVDLREQELQVLGQELMTQDKATLRLNLIMKHRVIDPLRSMQEVQNLRDSLYAEMQLAARQAVASATADQLMEQRSRIATQMAETVKMRAEEWGIEVLRMDIKDIVLPGDMKNLLNQVIEAEKKAAALAILRREEVAATRSLANTARILENNPILLRLKELESWKEIATASGQFTLVAGNSDLLSHMNVIPQPSKQDANKD